MQHEIPSLVSSWNTSFNEFCHPRDEVFTQKSADLYREFKNNLSIHNKYKNIGESCTQISKDSPYFLHIT